jgi:hypothetical protein
VRNRARKSLKIPSESRVRFFATATQAFEINQPTAIACNGPRRSSNFHLAHALTSTHGACLILSGHVFHDVIATATELTAG